jgi:hypothetical protein
MTRDSSRPFRRRVVIRSLVEIGFVMFLFYSNLLMGEFTRSAGHGKALAAALNDILTPENFITVFSPHSSAT